MTTRHTPGRLLGTIVIAGLVAALVAVLVGACSGPPGAGTVPPAVLERTTPTAQPTAEPTAGRERPQLVTWGGDGAHLALVVENATGSTIRRALVEIEARDADGRLLLRTVGRPGSKCCTLLGVRPRAEFALFAVLPDHVGTVADVAEVRVRYAELDLAPTRRTRGWVEPENPRLQRVPGDAVVTATLVAGGRVPAYVVGQALLVDRKGRLEAVISGRFYCVTTASRREIRMHLTRPVPRGTRIARALAHPIPRGVPTDVDHRCD